MLKAPHLISYMSLCHTVETIVKVAYSEKKDIAKTTEDLVLRNCLDELCFQLAHIPQKTFSSLLSRVNGKRTSIVNLIIPTINRALEQLINLLLGHLLAQVRQDVLDLSLSDESRPVLVEDLEPSDVLFDVEGLAEATRSVQDLGEGFKVD